MQDDNVLQKIERQASANQAKLLKIFSKFTTDAGWNKPCVFPYVPDALCLQPTVKGKMTTKDLDPRALLMSTMLQVQYKKWRLTITPNVFSGMLQWRMEGAADKHTGEWEFDDDDQRIVSMVESCDPELTTARARDDANARNFPYVRRIEGINFTKADKDKRGNRYDSSKRKSVGSSGGQPVDRPKFGDKGALDRKTKRTRASGRNPDPETSG